MSEVTSKKKIPAAIEQLMDQVSQLSKEHPRWGEVFRNCFADTLLTTIKYHEDGTTYVLTGDIPAMWLRDSTAQVRPYLVAADDSEVSGMIAGLVKKQFRYINIDPYANAFNEEANGQGHQADKTDMGPWIWERKYEIDSLCYPIQLSYLLWKGCGRTDQFDEEFRSGVEKILDVWETEQNHDNSSYRFERTDCVASDTLVRDGLGSPVAVTGLLWSGFRPSDDSCRYHYLIPANMFAVVALRYLEEIYNEVLEKNEAVLTRIKNLKQAVVEGIQKYAVVKNKAGKDVYAYEVDGLGNASIMDDANVPSLLAAPYLGYCSNSDPLYLNTRETLLSQENPYYYSGAYVEGIGSQHTPERYVWPIALSMQGMTCDCKAEKERILDVLCSIDAGTNQMHEGVCVDDPAQFSREWFSWSNMMFCELLMDYYDIRIKQ